jgi:beta-fructofuranosidase
VLDDGPSLYAPQAVPAGGADGGPERVLVWGWARELVGDEVRARTETERDAAGWSGTLTHPLELMADGDRVFTVPARELIALRGETADPAELPDQAELILSGVGAAELRLAAPGEVGQLVWRRRLSGEQVRVLIDASLVEVFPEGRTAGTHRAYPTGEQSYRLVTEPGVHAQAWTLRLP